MRSWSRRMLLRPPRVWDPSIKTGILTKFRNIQAARTYSNDPLPKT
jgi:hypothetical protein